MIIDRFGSTYAGAYALPAAMLEDDWQSARPTLADRVSGRYGAFDYFGDDANPIAALRVTRRSVITATTWAGVETALDALRAALNAATAENKLWGLCRDGSKRWAWAKVESVRAPDRVGQILHCPVDLAFGLREGLWYSETAHSEAKTATGAHVLANAGNVRTPVKVTVVPAVATLTAFAVSATGQGWAWAGSLAAGQSLIVDAAAYAVTRNGSDDYAALTLTEPSTFWLYLEPGNNTLTLTRTQGVSGTFTATFEWSDTWVM